MNKSPDQKTKLKTFLIEGKGKKGCWRVLAESKTVDRAPRRRPGKGGRCSLLTLSINRYICISLCFHYRASSNCYGSPVKWAKPLIETLEPGSPFPLRRHH